MNNEGGRLPEQGLRLPRGRWRKMPKRNEPQLTPEEQLKRFQQAAKEPEIKKVVSQIECAFDAPAEKRPKTEGRPHEGSAETDPPRQLILRGSRVETDAEGNVSLNDLWKIAGEPANKRARDWRRYAGAKSLMAALVKRIVGITHNSSEDTEKKLFFSTGKGVAAKTFAHPVLALA